MALAVCLHSNIYDENGDKRLRGDAWEASDEWIADVLARDEKDGRQPRITVVEAPKPKRGRPKKDETDVAE